MHWPQYILYFWSMQLLYGNAFDSFWKQNKKEGKQEYTKHRYSTNIFWLASTHRHSNICRGVYSDTRVIIHHCCGEQTRSDINTKNEPFKKYCIWMAAMPYGSCTHCQSTFDQRLITCWGLSRRLSKVLALKSQIRRRKTWGDVEKDEMWHQKCTMIDS